jgi:hypothetical protein
MSKTIRPQRCLSDRPGRPDCREEYVVDAPSERKIHLPAFAEDVRMQQQHGKAAAFYCTNAPDRIDLGGPADATALELERLGAKIGSKPELVERLTDETVDEMRQQLEKYLSCEGLVFAKEGLLYSEEVYGDPPVGIDPFEFLVLTFGQRAIFIHALLAKLRQQQSARRLRSSQARINTVFNATQHPGSAPTPLVPLDPTGTQSLRFTEGGT